MLQNIIFHHRFLYLIFYHSLPHQGLLFHHLLLLFSLGFFIYIIHLLKNHILYLLVFLHEFVYILPLDFIICFDDFLHSLSPFLLFPSSTSSIVFLSVCFLLISLILLTLLLLISDSTSPFYFSFVPHLFAISRIMSLISASLAEVFCFIWSNVNFI